MAFCTNCGSGLTEDSRFCPNCGKKVTAAPVSAPVETPAPAKKPRFRSAIIGILLGALAIALIIGIGEYNDNGTKRYTCQELRMEIPVFMKDVSKDYSDFTFVLDSGYVGVFGLRESISDIGEMSLKEYTELVMNLNGTKSYLYGSDNHFHFSYTGTADNGEEVRFSVYTFKSGSAYWMLQFVGPKDSYFSQIANSVTFQ